MKTILRRLLPYALLCLVCPFASGADEKYDVIVRGGKIVDGTGNPWFVGDVAIRGDRIAAIDRALSATAVRELDASGKVVCPGFIDMHSHSDYLLLEDGNAESKIRQGVTTEILGEGDSAGPLQGRQSPRAMVVGHTKYTWSTMAEYYQAVEQAGISTNIASYVGLNNVWESVMGSGFERPTPEQLQQMQHLVAEAMHQGALGLSSQVMMPPGSLATTDDIVKLCEIVAQYRGIYSTHIRNEGLGVFDSVKEAIEIAERAGIPVDIIHLKIADQQLWGQMNQLIELIDSARARGVNVQANVYPYTRGNNDLVSIIPPWAHEGGKDKLLERLRDPEQRRRMKEDIRGTIPGWYNHLSAVGGDWSRVLVSGNNSFKGLTMDRVFSLRSGGHEEPDHLDELFDILLEEGGSVGAVYAHHTDADMQLALQQPWCSVGSDGSALAIEGPLRRGNPHPRSFGTFPRVLGTYVRQEGLLRLEDAIRKMTSLNAAKAGLAQRGLLAEGFYADLTVFDPQTIRDLATYTEPFQYSEGVDWVIVNGQVVLDRGQHTKARPGRALRRGRSSDVSQTTTE
jgi:N-acyl-D-aspartate/D-glutamate deacylase